MLRFDGNHFVIASFNADVENQQDTAMKNATIFLSSVSSGSSSPKSRSEIQEKDVSARQPIIVGEPEVEVSSSVDSNTEEDGEDICSVQSVPVAGNNADEALSRPT